MKIYRISDYTVLEIQKNNEIFLTLLDQILELLLKGASETKISS